MPSFDVVILGGGPAGSATALALRRHAPELSIALIERSADFTSPRIGETLPPGAQPLLEQLGIWTAFQQAAHLPAYGTKVSWGTPELIENDFVFAARGNGWHLDRRRFDTMLLTECRNAGITVLQPCRVTAADQQTNGSWNFSMVGDQFASPFTARFVVDASGRSAWFARRFGGASPILLDNLVGVFCFFRSNRNSPVSDRATLVESAEEGYWYAALLPNDTIAVAFMTDADIAHRGQLGRTSHWSEMLSRTKHCDQLVRSTEPISPPAIRPAHSQRLSDVGHQSWLAVGDAASTFDPLSSQGIFKALRSGIFASYAIADQLHGRSVDLSRYQQFIGGEFDRYLETRGDYYAQENRWSESPFWMRRLQSVSLDPFSMLIADRPDPGNFPQPTANLAPQDMHLLRDLCRVPIQARHVVSAFKQQRPAVASDQSVILALQSMIQNGVIASSHP